VVGAWDAEYMRAPPARRLLMLYLANDILQNSRRKVPQ
jgi:CID domain